VLWLNSPWVEIGIGIGIDCDPDSDFDLDCLISKVRCHYLAMKHYEKIG